MNRFREYFFSLSVKERQELAKDADTSVKYLEHIAYERKYAGLKTIRNLRAADESIREKMFPVNPTHLS